VDNTYSTFSAGGADFLVLNLELWPRQRVVGWAQGVVASHPRHNVIVVTHSYLTYRGEIYDRSEYGEASPQYLFDHLVKLYPNVKLVLSGHTGRSTQRTDVGVKGNRIVSLLLAMHDRRTNPLRLVEINTVADSLSTWVYAPATDQAYPACSRAYAGMGWIRS
jgi:hypothetical protein